MFQVIFTLIAVVGASVHIAFSPKRRSSGAALPEHTCCICSSSMLA